MLFANDAVFIPGIRYTQVFIKVSQTHRGLLFLLHCQGQNGVGGADLSAEVAAVLAISLAHIGYRRPQLQQAAANPVRPQAGSVGLTDAYTLLAAQAFI